MGGEFNVFHWLVVLAVILPLYFLPSILARNKPQAHGVFLLNLFVGWTAFGWAGALVWALWEEPRPTRVMVQNTLVQPSTQPSVVFCSSCGKPSVLDLGSNFCCGCDKPIAP